MWPNLHHSPATKPTLCSKDPKGKKSGNNNLFSESFRVITEAVKLVQDDIVSLHLVDVHNYQGEGKFLNTGGFWFVGNQRLSPQLQIILHFLG